MASSADRLFSLPHQPDALPRPVMTVDGMQGGTGGDSYAHNSRAQNYNFHAFAKPHLAQAIEQCDLLHTLHPVTDCFRIADFGCSHGRNTLDYAEFIVEQVRQKWKLAPEIQYFFSDLPSNDFNNLFQTFLPNGKQEAGRQLQTFYAAGVPGSFYTRLFPKSSLDFAICAYSLHWLSQVPDPVVDKTSTAWNSGHVWIHGERPKVAEAFAQQFQSDVKSFLKCRAQELAEGAVLFLFSICRAEEQPTGSYLPHYDTWCGYFESAWDELVSEGVVEAEERDMFNVPNYAFHRAELELALKDVPELQLLKLEVMEDCPNLPEDEMQQLLNDPNRFGEYWVGFLKSLIKPMVQKHIGEDRTTEFFNRLKRIATERANLTTYLAYDLLVAVLRRS